MLSGHDQYMDLRNSCHMETVKAIIILDLHIQYAVTGLMVARNCKLMQTAYLSQLGVHCFIVLCG